MSSCALALAIGLVAAPGRLGAFEAEAGDGRSLDRAALSGKVILAFYEADGEQDINAALKAELKQFNLTQLEHLDRLAVIPFADVSRIFWPFTAIARSRLGDVSKELGLIVYGDWDGKVREAFGFVVGAPNLVVVDERGVIRLRASGKIPAEDFDRIKRLIKTLVDGEQTP